MKKQSIQNLIVGVDFSDYSKLVVKEAKKLSEKLKLPTTYVFAYEDIDLYYPAEVLDRKSLAPLYEKKMRQVYDLNEKDKVMIRFGLPEKEIIAVARKTKNPLLMVGYRGRSALSRIFLGSVAEKLATISPFPLWIHRGNKIITPQRILIPSDFSYRSDRTIEQIGGVKSAFKARVEVYHVQPEITPIGDFQAWVTVEEAVKKYEGRKLRAFQKAHPKMKITRGRGAVVRAINERAKKFDVIALSPHSQKSRISFGKVTGKLVRSAEKPVLVLP